MVQNKCCPKLNHALPRTRWVTDRVSGWRSLLSFLPPVLLLKLSNDAGDSLSLTSDLPCLPIDVCQLLPKTDTELFDVAKDAVIDSRVDGKSN